MHLLLSRPSPLHALFLLALLQLVQLPAHAASADEVVVKLQSLRGKSLAKQAALDAEDKNDMTAVLTEYCDQTASEFVNKYSLKNGAKITKDFRMFENSDFSFVVDLDSGIAFQVQHLSYEGLSLLSVLKTLKTAGKLQTCSFYSSGRPGQLEVVSQRTLPSTDVENLWTALHAARTNERDTARCLPILAYRPGVWDVPPPPAVSFFVDEKQTERHCDLDPERSQFSKTVHDIFGPTYKVK